MKIKRIEVFVFKYDHHYRLGGHTDTPNRIPGTDYYFEPQWKQAYSRLLESCLVKIETDQGLIGWGEAQAPLVPEVAATLITRLFGPAILGLNPAKPEIIYDRLYHLSHVRGHTASYTIDAITAIDIALWDIKGQYENSPLNMMFGQMASMRLPLYVSGLRLPDPNERKDLAKECINAGFKGIKIFSGSSADETLQEFEGIRSAIEPDAELAIDAICTYDYDSAKTIGRGLDELNAAWFESPLDPEDVAGHSRLAKALRTPLAIGEPLRTIREFQPWIDQKAMEIAQPDIVRCGITGGRRIIDLAQSRGLKIAPHIGVCTAIGVAATWHVSSTLENAISQEHQLEMFESANKVLNRPLQVESGHGIVPEGPGLGIDVDEAFVVKNSSEAWVISEHGIEYKTNINLR